ncbi:MAG: hypothetical protein HYX53_13130 [Chloroflexi bacterium]|nr:hypothetical protein [Chloroflexota bacterium]
MHQRPRPPHARPPSPGAGIASRALQNPRILIPVAVVVGVLALAFGVQPGGDGNAAAKQDAPATVAITTPAASPSATTAPTKAPAQLAAASATAAEPGSTAEVAGARATPAGASPTPQVDFSRETTQCGSLQETATAVTVEQAISGVSIRANRVATYPIEYFRCILMATGGQESIALASSVSKAQKDGATHAVLIDLWLTNAAKDFGQVSLRSATLAAAGSSFSPLATLGGRSDVVVSSGQGRSVTLVMTIKNTVGTNTGPMTLAIDAPMANGRQLAGKYQLFLPTP